MQDHQNRLNTIIDAELNCGDKLMCSNFTSKSYKDRNDKCTAGFVATVCA